MSVLESATLVLVVFAVILCIVLIMAAVKAMSMFKKINDVTEIELPKAMKNLNASIEEANILLIKVNETLEASDQDIVEIVSNVNTITTDVTTVTSSTSEFVSNVTSKGNEIVDNIANSADKIHSDVSNVTDIINKFTDIVGGKKNE
ncbi:MAG: hypothetical protein ACRCUP_01030 [Mycoplasmatales bacterium]